MAAVDDITPVKKPNSYGDQAAAGPGVTVVGGAGGVPSPAAGASTPAQPSTPSPVVAGVPTAPPVNTPLALAPVAPAAAGIGLPAPAAPVTPNVATGGYADAGAPAGLGFAPAAPGAPASVGQPAPVAPPAVPAGNTALSLAPVGPTALPSIPNTGVLTLPGMGTNGVGVPPAPPPPSARAYTYPQPPAPVVGAPIPASTGLGMTQADVRAVDNNPANAAAIAAAPLAPEGFVPQGGVSVLNGVDPASRVAQMNRDTADQKALDDAKIAQARINDPTPGMATIANPGPSDAQRMFDGAALRSAAEQGTWSPRKGFQGNDAAVAAAAIPVNAENKADADQLAANTQLGITQQREAGDTARAAAAQAGETTRSGASNKVSQQNANTAAAELGIKQAAAGYANASAARLDAAQVAVTNAKDPAAKRAAIETYNALAGRAPADNYVASEVGGGSTVDATTGVAVPSAKSTVIVNKATGEAQVIHADKAGTGPVTPNAYAEGSRSTAQNGKPIVYTNGKWTYA